MWQQQEEPSPCGAVEVTGLCVVTWGDPKWWRQLSSPRQSKISLGMCCSSAGNCNAIRAGGLVATWGESGGGDSSEAQDQLRSVVQINATQRAFVAILGDGSVVTWGDLESAGDNSTVPNQLRSVRQVRPTGGGAFAAILEDRSVFTWGKPDYGGDSSQVQDKLSGVQQVAAAFSAFAAILSDLS